MAIPLSDNIQNNSNKPDSNKYGPYASVADAKSAVVQAYRHLGLTVGITSGLGIKEYWWKNGILDADLVDKMNLGDLQNNRASLIHTDSTRTYYPSHTAALTDSVSGDILVLPSPIAIPDLVGTQAAQINLKEGVSVNTQGFQIGLDNTTGDTITIKGGVSNILGNGSLLRVNTSNNAWGIGASSATPTTQLNSKIQDLTVHSGWHASALSLNTPNALIELSRVIIKAEGDANAVRLGYLGSNPTVTFNNCTFFILGDTRAFVMEGALAKFNNCTFFFDSTVAEFLFLGSSSVTLRGCKIFCTSRASTGPIFNISAGTATIVIEDTEIIGNGTNFATQTGGTGHTIAIKGNSSIKGIIGAGITVTDTSWNPWDDIVVGGGGSGGADYEFKCDPDIKTTSDDLAIKGVVTDVAESRHAADGSSVTSGTFTYSYRLSTTGTWTTGVSFATLKTALLTADATRVMIVKATNVTSTVPSRAILTVTK